MTNRNFKNCLTKFFLWCNIISQLISLSSMHIAISYFFKSRCQRGHHAWSRVRPVTKVTKAAVFKNGVPLFLLNNAEKKLKRNFAANISIIWIAGNLFQVIVLQVTIRISLSILFVIKFVVIIPVGKELPYTRTEDKIKLALIMSSFYHNQHVQKRLNVLQYHQTIFREAKVIG